MSNQKNFLYKYRTIEEDKIDRSSRIFTHNELYFSSKDQFNDPFDCKFDYSFAATDQEIKKYFQTTLRRIHPNWNRKQKRSWIGESLRKIKNHDPEFERNLKLGTEKILSEIGMCSLSRIPNDILMWSHYANSHKGFCIKMLDDENEKFIAQAQAVSYSKDYPIVNPIKDDYMVRMKKSLLIKAKHWEYEEEWRIIDHEEGPGIKCFPPHLLIGVIFGCRMSKYHRGLIRKWCKNRQPDVSFYRAREAPRTYSLELIEE